MMYIHLKICKRARFKIKLENSTILYVEKGLLIIGFSGAFPYNGIFTSNKKEKYSSMIPLFKRKY